MDTTQSATTQSPPHPKMMRDVKFYLGRVCTRWHVYPQQHPLEVLAHDWHGFWAISESGEWFKSPISYNFECEITQLEAETLRTTSGLTEWSKDWVLRQVTDAGRAAMRALRGKS